MVRSVRQRSQLAQRSHHDHVRETLCQQMRDLQAVFIAKSPSALAPHPPIIDEGARLASTPQELHSVKSSALHDEEFYSLADYVEKNS